MEKICYITGAGVSSLAGIPVMSNFIYKAKDLYYSSANSINIDESAFNYVFNKIESLSKIKTYCNSDLLNIEEVLSILEMESTFLKTRASSNFKKFITDVILGYTPTLSGVEIAGGRSRKNIFSSDEKIDLLGYFYASILRLKLNQKDFYDQLSVSNFESNHNYSIISLNYDLIPELISSRISRYFKFEKDTFSEKWTDPMLLKIHGDIEDNSIIPPTWSKSISKEMKSKWENAYRLLSEATQIRFIGYSLPISDSYMQYFLKVCVTSSLNLKKIDVITLDSDGETEKRFRSLFCFKDFRFRNMNIRDYLLPLKAEFEANQNNQNSYKNEVTFNRLELAHDLAFND